MADDAQTRKLATIVALDVAGYSARTEADEARTTAEVAALRKVIEGIATKRGGRVFNTAGDGFMLEFGSSLAAVEAAFELAETCEPKVRVGVHLGDVVVQPNGDLLGHGVNVAARLMAQADPGTALVSAGVQHTIRGPLAQSLHSKGIVKLPKMAEAIEVFARVPGAAVKRDLPARLKNLWAKRKTLSRANVAITGAAAIALIAGWMLLTPSSVQAPPMAAVSEASVAVLPFENLSTDKDNAFFAAGIQDEILTRLTKIGSLKVISRTSTAHLASSPDNLPEIAKQLGVAHVLEGSVQRHSDAVRVNVQLIKASTDSHIWAEGYDRKLENIFSVQSEIAIAVAETLSAKVTGKEKRELTATPTKNTAAYDAYLRGSAFKMKGEYQSGERLLQQAVQLDPKFAGAWALLAQTHAWLFHMGDRTKARREAAQQALDAAVRLRPEATDTMLAQAYHQYWVERDFAGARRRFEHVRAEWPNNANVVSALGRIARRQGRWDEARDYMKRAVELDPRSMSARFDLPQTQFHMRDFAQALRDVDTALNIWPDAADLMGLKAEILQALGQLDQAGEAIKGIQTKPEHFEATDAIFFQALYTRRTAEAISAFQAVLVADKAAGSPGTMSSTLNLYLGILKRMSGDASGATAHFDLARDELVSESKLQPGNGWVLAFLALMYSSRGEHDEAMRLADQLVKLTPVTQDAFDGAWSEAMRARVLARSGDRERAIPAIARLLKLPGGLLSPAILRLDPDFDKLRGDSRFEALARRDETPK